MNYDAGYLAGRIMSTHGSILLIPKGAGPHIAPLDIRTHKFINSRRFAALLINDPFLVDEVTPSRAAELVKKGDIRAEDFYFVAVRKVDE